MKNNIYANQFWQRINGGLENPNSLRAVLDTYHGVQLVSSLRMGEEEVSNHFPWLSQRTRGLLTECTQLVERSWLEMSPNWDASDHYDRYGTLKGLAAGAFSEETAIGSAIGTALLPGIGTVIGGAIGGFIAGNKIDAEATRHIELLDHQFQTMIQSMENFYNTNIVPSIETDIRMLNDGANYTSTPLQSQTDFVSDAIGFVVVGIGLVLLHWIFVWLGISSNELSSSSFNERIVLFEPLWVYVIGGLIALIGLALEVQKGLSFVTELISVLISFAFFHVAIVVVNVLILSFFAL